LIPNQKKDQMKIETKDQFTKEELKQITTEAQKQISPDLAVKSILNVEIPGYKIEGFYMKNPSPIYTITDVIKIKKPATKKTKAKTKKK
jgi:hypothetical protein